MMISNLSKILQATKNRKCFPLPLIKWRPVLLQIVDQDQVYLLQICEAPSRNAQERANNLFRTDDGVEVANAVDARDYDIIDDGEFSMAIQ